MHIYSVIGSVDYEGSEFLGSYGSEAEALDAARFAAEQDIFSEFSCFDSVYVIDHLLGQSIDSWSEECSSVWTKVK